MASDMSALNQPERVPSSLRGDQGVCVVYNNNTFTPAPQTERGGHQRPDSLRSYLPTRSLWKNRWLLFALAMDAIVWAWAWRLF